MFEGAKPVGTLGTAMPLPLLLLLVPLLLLVLLPPLLLDGSPPPPQAVRTNSSSIASRFRGRRVNQCNQCRSVNNRRIDPKSVLPNPMRDFR
jgi:hypothetical protein